MVLSGLSPFFVVLRTVFKGNKEEIKPINLTGSLIRIGFNSKYLLDALRVLESNEVSLKFTGEVRPFIIQSDDLTVTQLILPVRIE